jgi:dTDP-4-amino-4,6-dideoxy-D-glucose acyltransferase
MNACYSRDELMSLGFRGLGNDVRLSRKASVYGADRIVIGSHVRIDDFCVLSAGKGGIVFGDYIHLAVYSSIIGAGTVTLQDFVNISARVGIYSSNDDYSGSAMTNPMVPSQYTNVQIADILIGRHSIIGCGSILLPGVTLGEAVAVGALSLIKDDCLAFGIYSGVPARWIRERKRDLCELESRFRSELHQQDKQN